MHTGYLCENISLENISNIKRWSLRNNNWVLKLQWRQTKQPMTEQRLRNLQPMSDHEECHFHPIKTHNTPTSCAWRHEMRMDLERRAWTTCRERTDRAYSVRKFDARQERWKCIRDYDARVCANRTSSKTTEVLSSSDRKLDSKTTTTIQSRF